MKRFIFFVAVVVSISVCVPFQQADGNSKVLVILQEGKFRSIELSLTKEVGVMISMLKEEGFEVEVATASGKPIVARSTILKPDLKLTDVKVNDYAGIIIPCMAIESFPWRMPPEAVAIVKKAVAEGKPVAAQVGAVYVLLKAGALKGKRYALHMDPLNPRYGPRDVRFADAIYSGRGVIKDGNIITSGICPYVVASAIGLEDRTAKLTKAFIDKLNRQSLQTSQEASVINVVDGHTIRVVYQGRTEVLRLIGVDAPARGQPGYVKALLFTTRMVKGQKLHLGFDQTLRDEYGRLLAYVYLPYERMLNEGLIRQGYGRTYTKYPFKYMKRFMDFEKVAR